jgi:hypothetical protein
MPCKENKQAIVGANFLSLGVAMKCFLDGSSRRGLIQQYSDVTFGKFESID